MPAQHVAGQCEHESGSRGAGVIKNLSEQLAMERAGHALDLSHEGITLFRSTGINLWEEVAHVPLQVGTVAQHLAELAELAAPHGLRPVPVEAWLPEEPLKIREIEMDGRRLRNARVSAAFAEGEDGIDCPLAFDGSQQTPTGKHLVAAVPATVLAEARDFLEAHGFRITRYTTQNVPEGLVRRPVFDYRQRPDRQLPPLTPALIGGGAVAAAAAVALGLYVAITGSGGPAIEPVLDVQQIALAPSRAPALDSIPAAPTPPTPLTQPQGAVAPVAGSPQADFQMPPPLPSQARAQFALADWAAPATDALPLGGRPDPARSQSRDIPALALWDVPDTPNMFLASVQTRLAQQIAPATGADAPVLAAAETPDVDPRSEAAGLVAIIDTAALPTGLPSRALARPLTPLLGPLAFGAPATAETPGAALPVETAALIEFGPAPRPSVAASTPPAAVPDPPALPDYRVAPSGVRIYARLPSEIPPPRPFAPEPATEAAPETDLAEDAAPETAPEAAPAAPLVTVIAARPDMIPPGRPQPAEPGAVTVIAAAPDIAPPGRPGPAEAPAATATGDTTPDPQAGVTVVAALPDVTPPARPASVTPSLTTGQTEAIAALVLKSQEDALAPSPDALRAQSAPRPRPAAMVRAEQARVERLALLAPSDLALKDSIMPRARPRGLHGPELAALPAPDTRIAPPANDAPSAVVPRTAPVLPTSASVARAATIKDAMPMRRTALVGVFGKSSNRNALLRLSNGRYVKVQVGDTVDGYEVAAIGSDEIRLRRRGRDTVLVIPN